MTQTSGGWFRDPYPAAPGDPPRLRYWDGEVWTEHVTDPQAPVYDVPSTPDGEPLAGWWSRAWAQVIDTLVMLVVVVLVSVPYWGRIGDAFSDYLDEMERAEATGAPAPSQLDLQASLGSALVVISILTLLFNLLYNVGFLRWKGATPGKMALGLGVRLRERPGTMPWSTILLRWGTQFGIPQLLGLVPVVGFTGRLFTVLDYLWPLWDSKRQALHDKVASTNVVRRP